MFATVATLSYNALRRSWLETVRLARGTGVGVPRQPALPQGNVMAGHLAFDRDALTKLCRDHGIRKLALFGSVLKGSARPESDVDLLVEFEPGAAPSLLDMARIEAELSALLGGRRVDLRTAQDLSRYFRDEVVRGALVQYVAA
jgi:predicted nucleotidyltransferase